MSLIYKTLFEVKLMHEFFLTASDGKTPFALSNQQQRLNFLLESFSEDRLSVNEALQYEFPENQLDTYNKYGLRLLTGYSGFKVAIRVNEKILADQSRLYEPLAPLPDDLVIAVFLTRKNNSIDGYTNARFSNAVPSGYFFSNDNLGGTQTVPFLTAAVPDFSATHVYEQGELALFGGTDILGYYNAGSGDQWEPVAGTGFANENDRLLASPSFSYSFPATPFVTEALFTLKNSAGDIVQTIAVDGADQLRKTHLDFSPQFDFLSIPPGTPLKNSIYSLEVTGNNGYSAKHKLVFSNSIFTGSVWGTVCMKATTTNNNFRLIAADGFLIKRRDSLGVWTEAPVFEIPLKSRFVFWRYINDKGKGLDLVGELGDYLFKEDKVLLTRKPRALARSWFLLQKEGSTDTKYVPNPVGYELKKDKKERICFDVRVPESALFPVV